MGVLETVIVALVFTIGFSLFVFADLKRGDVQSEKYLSRKYNSKPNRQKLARYRRSFALALIGGILFMGAAFAALFIM